MDESQQQLSGGAKFGYLALGFFLGLIGVLIAWLTSKDKGSAYKSGAIKFSVIGFVIVLVLGIVFTLVITPMLAASMTALY